MFVAASTCKMERFVALFDVGRYMPMFGFTVKHTSVLNDLYFTLRLVNVMFCLSNLSYKCLKMIPKLASKGVFFEIQNVYSLCIVSKFNLEANLDSNGHPNEAPNGVQNRGHELAVRASVRVGASGRAKPRS